MQRCVIVNSFWCLCSLPLIHNQNKKNSAHYFSRQNETKERKEKWFTVFFT